MSVSWVLCFGQDEKFLESDGGNDGRTVRRCLMPLIKLMHLCYMGVA